MKIRTLLNLGLIIGAVVLVFAVTLPLYREGEQLEILVPQKQQELMEKEQLKRRLDSLRATISQIEEEVVRVEQMVPVQPSVPELVVSLEAIADKNGVVLRDVGIVGAETRSPQFRSGGSSNQQQEYRTLTFSIDITGSYEAIEAFLRDIELNLRLIDVSTVDLSFGGEAGGNVFNAAVQAQAYYLNE